MDETACRGAAARDQHLSVSRSWRSHSCARTWTEQSGCRRNNFHCRSEFDGCGNPNNYGEQGLQERRLDAAEITTMGNLHASASVTSIREVTGVAANRIRNGRTKAVHGDDPIGR